MHNIRNSVTLIGNVGRDPEVKVFDNGNKTINFSFATSKTYKNKEGEKVTDTQWHRIVAWGKTVDLVERFFKKGLPFTIEGELTYREYESNGEKKSITEIVLNSFIPHAKAEKRESVPPPAPVAAPEPIVAEATADSDLPF